MSEFTVDCGLVGGTTTFAFQPAYKALPLAPRGFSPTPFGRFSHVYGVFGNANKTQGTLKP